LRQNTDFSSDYTCPLCSQHTLENLQTHILTSCPQISDIRQNFIDIIKAKSPKTYDKYLTLPDALKPSWILTFGEKSTTQYYNNNDNTVSEGESVTEGINKSNTDDKLKAIQEYIKIKLKLNRHILRIYTDGSKRGQQVGSGYVIFKENTILDRRSKSLKDCENNAAELYAIFDALSNISRFIERQQKQPIHIFTDSRYCIDTLAQHTKITKHHRIINLIHNICNNLNIVIVLHWIPSHIEVSSHNEVLKIHGNEIADQLASSGALNPKDVTDYNTDFIQTPQFLTTHVASFLGKIDMKIQETVGSKHPTNDGPSNDDFRLSDAQQNAPYGDSVTS
jgi:ribonuclease HI